MSSRGQEWIQNCFGPTEGQGIRIKQTRQRKDISEQTSQVIINNTEKVLTNIWKIFW